MNIIQNLTSVNFTPKTSRTILGVVLHSMWGTQAGSIAWFKNSTAQASAHYCISKDGEIVQCVLDKDVAWHAGVIENPNIYYPNGIPAWALPNPNATTIGIELEDNKDSNWSYPEAQKSALIELCNFLSNKYSIPKDEEHFLLHRKLCPSRRSDPVGTFDIKWITGSTIVPMDPYEQKGLDNLRAYRQVRVQGPEGNFEGFVNSIIGSDKEKPGLIDSVNKFQSEISSLSNQLTNTQTILKTKEAAIESMKDQIKFLQDALANSTPQVVTVIKEVIKEPVFKTPLATFFYNLAKKVDG